jgi:hypothetical protein
MPNPRVCLPAITCLAPERLPVQARFHNPGRVPVECELSATLLARSVACAQDDCCRDMLDARIAKTSYMARAEGHRASGVLFFVFTVARAQSKK